MKKATIFRKMLGLFCALVLIVGAAYVPTAFTADADTPLPLTFKDYPYDTTNKNVFGDKTMSIYEAPGLGFDDDYALRFNFDGDAIYETKPDGTVVYMNTRAQQKDHVATIGKISSGSKYKVSFYYKAGDECVSNFIIKLVAGSSESILDTASYRLLNQYNVRPNVKNWTQVTAIIDASIPETSDTLYVLFGTVNSLETYVDAYIDNVVVEKLSENMIIFNSTVAGIPNQVVSGNVGDTFTAPTMVNGKAPLVGWYTDMNCTIPFTATTIPEGVTNVYAKWGIVPITFEGYPYDTTDPFKFGKATMSIYNQEGIGIDDDYALRFNFDGDAVYKEEAGEITYMNDRAQQRDHIATIGKLKVGATYKVSYFYKVGETCETSADITLVAGSGNIWDTPNFKKFDTTKITVTTATKDWVKATFVFKADIAAGAEYLYVLFGSTDRSVNSYVDAYIDNVTVQELVGDIIIFDGNAPGVYGDAIDGVAGTPYVAPTLVNGKSPFVGWYLDSVCTEPFNSKTIPEGITTVYAKWGVGPVTFENYPYDTTNGLIFGARTLSLYNKNGVGYDDDYALRFKFDGSIQTGTKEDGTPTYLAERGQLRDHVATVGRVKKGGVYQVSYYYKAGKECETEFSISLALSGAGNIWGDNYKLITPTKIFVKPTDTEWQKASFIFNADGNDQATTLFIQFNTTAKKESVAEAYVDNVLVEELVPPYILVNKQSSEESTLYRGVVGDEIKLPTPKRYGYSFEGWYRDPECTTEFTDKVFTEKTALTVYAKWKRLSTTVYHFDNYDFEYMKTSGTYMIDGCTIVNHSNAYSGNKVVKFDRDYNYNQGGTYIVVGEGREKCLVAPGKNYVVSLNYTITGINDHVPPTVQVALGSPDNFWGREFQSVGEQISWNCVVDEWYNMVFYVNAKELTKETALFIKVTRGTKEVLYFDDVTITELPEGYGAVAISNGGFKKLPAFVMGKIGSNYYNKLPKNPNNPGMYFQGYFSKNGKSYETLDTTKTFFEKDTIPRVHARFTSYKVTQNFDGTYLAESMVYPSHPFYDFDYEVYDSQAEGNSANNVTSGRYSLHRKGDSMHIENALILTRKSNLSETNRYTVTFKVKIGEHKHTDGAIKIVSGRTYTYQWSTTGDYYAVAAIKDIADGNWHELTYTFNSVEPYFVIQTPGYVEVFIDDVELNLILDPNAPLSTPAQYTEYIPAKLDSAGNYVSPAVAEIDLTTLIVNEIYAFDFFTSIYFYIAIGAIVVGAVVTVLLILKKKKKAKV